MEVGTPRPLRWNDPQKQFPARNVEDLAAFVKHDSGKLRYDLIDNEFEAELAKVLTHGAKTYADNNWQNANPEEALARYYAALRRHLAAWRRGEEIDADSGCPHLICVACCAMFLRWFERTGSVGAVPGGDQGSPPRDV